MSKSTFVSVKTFSRIAALAAAMFLVAASRPAFAASAGPVTVGIVEVTGNGILIQLTGGQNFQAFTSVPPADCFSVSPDAVKGWQTLAQSALLAGKKIKIGYTVCNGGATNAINFIDLNK
jgi:hypothetical protein